MTARMLVVGAILLLSSWVVRAVGHGPPVALSQPFSAFPDRLEEWRGQDLRYDARIEDKLGVADYVSKIYRTDADRQAHLFVGFYPSQRHGEMIHSPKNCLPGNGWYIASRDAALIDVPSHAPFTANSFIVENGIDRQAVVYWYQQSGGRIVTNEYLGRAYLVLDSLTRNRSDAALIRVSVPVEHEPKDAVETALAFIRVAYPALMRFLPHDATSSEAGFSGS